MLESFGKYFCRRSFEDNIFLCSKSDLFVLFFIDIELILMDAILRVRNIISVFSDEGINIRLRYFYHLCSLHARIF